MSPVGPKRFDAFLSFNSTDRPAVQEVAKRLQSQGIVVSLDDWEMAPGRDIVSALAEALRDSKTCVVFYGPNGLGPWHKKEVQAATDMEARDESFHVILVLLPGAERPRRGDVAHLDFLLNAPWVEFLSTLDDERAFQRLVWGITGKKPPEPETVTGSDVCPYRGLEAFRPEDAKFFFGRENLTAWLVSTLRREVRAAEGVRFLGVLGPSGSGKSSVVLAGLVPQLKEGAIEGSERWPVAILRPGNDPLKALTERVVPLIRGTVRCDSTVSETTEQKQLLDDLRSERADACDELDRYVGLKFSAEPADRRLVIVVDQFEEIFTHRSGADRARERFERERGQFFASLLSAAARPGGRVAVVLTLRSDFLSACAQFERLSAVLSAHQELVGPMTEAELRAAIERPAFLVGCEVEPALTERLWADVKGEPGALPLLQFALAEVWKKRDIRRLTRAAYLELGKDDKGQERGIEGVLDNRANQIYGDLTPENQRDCRRLFTRLVQFGEGTQDTKRRVPLREVLPGEPARAESVRNLVQTLSASDARLITTEGSDATDGAVEVAHEALIRGWTQLRKWLDAERADLRIQRRLSADAKEWADARTETKKDFLYSGVRLAVCREWVTSHPDELTAIEAAFVAASQEAKLEREQNELENERRKREAAEALVEQERRGRRLWMALAATVLTAVALAAVVVVPLVVEQSRERKINRWVDWARSTHHFAPNWRQMSNGLYQVTFNDGIMSDDLNKKPVPFPNRDDAAQSVIDRAVAENLAPFIGGLDLSRCRLSRVPSKINRFKKLESLIISRNHELDRLPREIGELTSLKALDLGQTAVTELPAEIGQLIALTKLDIPRANLSELPPEIGKLSNLVSLHLSNNNRLAKIPAQIGKLSNLIELHLDNTFFRELPQEVGDLSKLSVLHIAGNRRLTSLPKTILNLKNLEILSLSGSLSHSERALIGELRKRGVSVVEGGSGGGRGDHSGGGGGGGDGSGGGGGLGPG
jgi:hypothetical protein